MPDRNALNCLLAGALFVCAASAPMSAQSNLSVSKRSADAAKPVEKASKQLAYVPLIWSKEQPNHSHRHRMQEDVSSILASAQAVGEKWKHAGWLVAGGL